MVWGAASITSTKSGGGGRRLTFSGWGLSVATATINKIPANSTATVIFPWRLNSGISKPLRDYKRSALSSE
jgi:hypothetical protein